MIFDLQRARRDTPGCEHVLHFNNAGAALMPKPVLDATTGHLALEARIGGYEAAQQQKELVERVYDYAAALVGSHRDEIAIVENATRAWDMAFYAIPFQPGDRILTGVAEYSSNYIAMLQVARRTGAVIEVIPDDQYGQISVEALRNAIDERVKLIALTHVPTNNGLVNPAAAVGRIAREAGVLYLLDACQSVGQMPVLVDAIGCDMLATTSRKFLRGPRGMGFLYVRRNLIEELEPPFLDIRAASLTSKDNYETRKDARRFECWETNYAAKIGFGVAIGYCLQWGLENIQARITSLAETLRARLREIDEVTVRDTGAEQCGIVAFSVKNRNAADIAVNLRKERINVSTSSVYNLRLGSGEREPNGVVRASVHYYNSEEEVERFTRVLKSLLGQSHR